MVVMMPMVRVYSQHTIDAADDATGHAADNSADGPADRSQRTVAFVPAFVCALFGAPDHTLGLRQDRHRQQRHSRHHKSHFHDLFSSMIRRIVVALV
jgi:hypothetical protein